MNELLEFLMLPVTIYLMICIIISYTAGVLVTAYFKNKEIDEIDQEAEGLSIENLMLVITVESLKVQLRKAKDLLKTAETKLPERDRNGRFIKKVNPAPTAELFEKKGQIVDKQV